MLIEVKKTGKWALKGVKIVSVEKGAQDYNSDLAMELIKYGWAEMPKKKEIPAPISIPETANIDDEKYIVESVEKKTVGWWHVKFKGLELEKVRPADTEAEAIAKAIEEIEAK